MFRLLHKIT